MKNKIVTGILAFFFGAFGAHRFYLGQRKTGILYFLLFCFTMLITIEEGTPLIIFMGLLAFLDAIVFFAMPERDFDKKYNAEAIAEQKAEQQGFKAPTSMPRNQAAILKKKGIAAYREYDTPQAIQFFTKALQLTPGDLSLHFNLACCYSIEENAQEAIYHLDQAIEKGFNDFDKIQSHDALSWLRTQDIYCDFEDNGFQMPASPAPVELPTAEIPVPTPAEAPLQVESSDDLLDQIMRLGELKELGLLSEEEFSKQKQKLLG